ncbi:hypothetical protein RN001_005550 [Aquatica leii]|uniref:Uncharacterized protein n=1 Tax=Aquatica leii TaxID=1421715 RepID=A0AAN7PK14_9COLE|nr:hypothetical protein RN001_005550 [Aquatica leii]
MDRFVIKTKRANLSEALLDQPSTSASSPSTLMAVSSPSTSQIGDAESNSCIVGLTTKPTVFSGNSSSSSDNSDAEPEVS